MVNDLTITTQMKNRKRHTATIRSAKSLAMLLAAMLFVSITGYGCGSNPSNGFPNGIVDANGQAIVLDDIEAIVDNPNLPDDEKRKQLRDLGLEDEVVIEAFLSL